MTAAVRDSAATAASTAKVIEAPAAGGSPVWEPRPCEEGWWQTRQSQEDLTGRLLGLFTDPSAGLTRDKTRRRGLAKLLLSAVSSAYMRMSVSEISLTVTEGNSGAVDLYLAEGYTCEHTFDAAVWNRQRKV